MSSFPLARSKRSSTIANAVSLAIAWWLMLLSHPLPASDGANIEFFEKRVRPILVEHCYDCHGESKQQGGLRLDSREAWQMGGDSGSPIVAGSAKESLLVRAIRYEDVDLRMPPKYRLKESDIAAIVEWIDRGAADPRESTKLESKKMGMTLDEGRQFWAFQPLRKSMVARELNHPWVETPIDAFVYEGFATHGIRPAPPADRRTLIRRLALDLTGLPPTYEEIDEFVHDDSEGAYLRLVDRYLASPQYGVRWGRHWLDVARYADSNGLDENLAYGTAWKYRDYVINSFNQDKPFANFVLEQIAGDLIENPTRESKTATGFLVLGAKVLAEPDREKMVMDTIDEQIDTIGKAFLGLTLGCARCHDHKFDPISQRDYYGLAAVFKGTKTFGDTNFGAIQHWNEHVFADSEEKKRIQAIDDAIAAKQKVAAEFRGQAMQRIRETARARAADYLVAAASLAPDATLTEAESIAKPLSLHPRILVHCRRHVDFHRDQPLFLKWHEAYARQAITELESHYKTLFEQVQTAWKSLREKDPNAASLTDPELESVRQAIQDPSGFLAVPAKPDHAFDAETYAAYDRLMEDARLLESYSEDLDSAMGVAEGTVCVAMPIHIRGNHHQFGEIVSRNVPAVFHATAPPPVFSRKGSGRLELAHWLIQHAHALTARVYVNRIWRWHFGRGLVETTDNFGLLGSRPSHPELLDWLARYLIESGWSTKDVHRVILLSSTYQMASRTDKVVDAKADAGNRWLARFSRQRMSAEQIRDAILFVTGELESQLGGKSVPLRNRQFVFDHTSIDHTKYDSRRRAAYLPVIRNHLYDHFEQFDFPDPTMVSGDRASTTIAPQALILMNSDWVMESAGQLADRIAASTSSQDQQIQIAFRRILGREPSDAEMERVKAFYASHEIPLLDAKAIAVQDMPSTEWSPIALLCHALLMGNEFMYIR